MRESRSYGFVRGALSNERPYRVAAMLLSPLFNSTPIGHNVTFDSARKFAHVRWLRLVSMMDQCEMGKWRSVWSHYCRYYLFAGDSQRSKNNQGRIGVVAKHNRN
jgi:hypothetical protein